MSDGQVNVGEGFPLSYSTFMRPPVAYQSTWWEYYRKNFAIRVSTMIFSVFDGIIDRKLSSKSLKKKLIQQQQSDEQFVDEVEQFVEETVHGLRVFEQTVGNSKWLLDKSCLGDSHSRLLLQKYDSVQKNLSAKAYLCTNDTHNFNFEAVV